MGVDRHSDATKAKMRAAWARRRAALLDFWDMVDASGDCWLWTRSTGSAGYGQYWRHGQRHLTHRYAWQQLVGPIPSGMALDHLCRVPRCVNPDHLEVVTVGTNTRRGYSPIAMKGRAVACPKGHPFDATNTRIRPDGRRRCRACEEAYERQRRAAA